MARKCDRKSRSLMPRGCLYKVVVSEGHGADRRMLTTASPGKLGQPETSIVCWSWLKSNVAVPLRGTLVLRTLFAFIDELLFVELVELDRADGRYFRVGSSKFAIRVEHGMDVET
jgi:hypothetical protein